MQKDKKLLDFPLPFVICTYARSGSNFLMSLLKSTGIVTAGEFRAVVRPEGLDQLRKNGNLLPSFLKRCYGQNEHWGLSIHADQVYVLDRLFSLGIKPHEIRWIWLVRKDKVAQALSYLRMNRTKVSGILDADPELERKRIQNDIEVNISQDELFKYSLRLFFLDQIWETFFEGHGIPFHKIYYEDFIDPSTWEKTVEAILDFLSIPYEKPLNVYASTIKQSQQDKPRAYKKVSGTCLAPSCEKYLPFEKARHRDG